MVLTEITRRSTPYAFPAPPTGGDGVTGLYFIGFCKDQAPLRERMEAMYGINGQVRDRLTDFSNPASSTRMDITSSRYGQFKFWWSKIY